MPAADIEGVPQPIQTNNGTLHDVNPAVDSRHATSTRTHAHTHPLTHCHTHSQHIPPNPIGYHQGTKALQQQTSIQWHTWVYNSTESEASCAVTTWGSVRATRPEQPRVATRPTQERQHCQPGQIPVQGMDGLDALLSCAPSTRTRRLPHLSVLQLRCHGQAAATLGGSS